ncbi:CheY-like chemotaxis protein [Bradyrhizobium sp. i1.3.1]
MAEQDDVLHLIDDTGTAPEDQNARKWKIAVIDDDPAVHDGTRFALSDYSLNGQGLEILSAHSAAEGRKLMAAHGDIAAVLLDVIMETDVAGLELVEFIRNELKNETVRIILRTGQPGQAPERRVIVQYDINDYKAKTELTADKLFTSLTAALRSYQQLERMVQTRRGLEIIIDAASTLYDFKSMQRLAEGVLTQLASLLNVDCAGINWCCATMAAWTPSSPCSPAAAATAASSARPRRRRSTPICGRWWKPRSRAARTNSPTTAA